MELEEFHILQRNANPQRHGHAIAGIDKGIGRGSEHLPITAGGEQCGFCLDHQQFAGFNGQYQRAENAAFFVTDQINGEIFVKEMCPCADVLLIQGMQNGMTGTVRCGAGSYCLIAAEVLTLATKSALINFARVKPGKWHSSVFQFVDSWNGFAAHILDSVLITEVIRSLYGIEHMPVPVIGQYIGEGGVDAALSSNGVRTGWEDF